MTNKLQQYFPMIRTREEVLNEIESKSRLKNLFYEWTEENQNEFLDFCTGVKGIKIMYDFMIKEILNPENTLERVNELLTLLLGQRVRIVDVLPNDGTRLADESTLLITDMVVQLEDGSIANLEIQKIGYYFPGERSLSLARCYFQWKDGSLYAADRRGVERNQRKTILLQRYQAGVYDRVI